MKGLSLQESLKKFQTASELLNPILEKLHSDGLLDPTDTGYRLSSEGKRLTNLVFEKLTFLESDVAHHNIDK
jgi:DNA-binding PadR family transcriptional regulator